mmetsp:Transcript_1066/g.4532  ORF Transcript_1066/g.4532 Transcript_1066/m.4532 type:complete len:220 (-) Transcript_1066:1770-2429(-)
MAPGPREAPGESARRRRRRGLTGGSARGQARQRREGGHRRPLPQHEGQRGSKGSRGGHRLRRSALHRRSHQAARRLGRHGGHGHRKTRALLRPTGAILHAASRGRVQVRRRAKRDLQLHGGGPLATAGEGQPPQLGVSRVREIRAKGAKDRPSRVVLVHRREHGGTGDVRRGQWIPVPSVGEERRHGKARRRRVHVDEAERLRRKRVQTRVSVRRRVVL